MKNLKLTSALVLLGVLCVSVTAVETNQEKIYETQCIKCHGALGEGNPAKKAPALNHKSIGDLQVDIMDLQGSMSINGGSSGDNPDMEHNLKVFEDRGMIIDPLGMATYMHDKFNKKNK